MAAKTRNTKSTSRNVSATFRKMESGNRSGKNAGKIAPPEMASPEDFSSQGEFVGVFDIRNYLRKEMSYGHPQFISHLLDDMRLHSNKNYDYTGGGDALGNFKRVGAILAHYPNFPLATPRGVAVVYMLKHLDAVMWNMNQGHKMHEGRAGREQDIAIYATILRCMEDEGV